MPNSISSIKTRIKSINSTKKITGAMKSVSTVKLNRMTRITTKNNEYKDALSLATNALLSSNVDYESPYCLNNDSDKSLYIVFVSDIGLCGSYNESINSFIKKNVSKNDLIYLIGTGTYYTIKNLGYNIINDVIESDKLDYYNVASIYNEVLNMFFDNNVSSINLIYNKFINSISYETVCNSILPYKIDKKEKNEELILESFSMETFDMILDLFLKSELYNTFLNSKTSEQVARRFAMENATKNAEDLINNLTLEYNKARQSSITQEITEIVSGANAL